MDIYLNFGGISVHPPPQPRAMSGEVRPEEVYALLAQ